MRPRDPDALTPNPHLAYQNGGLHEVLLGLVLGLFALGRFVEFFARSDSPELGLDNAQWTSLALLAAVVIGWRLTRRGATRDDPI